MQLEKLLQMPEGSLTKEIELTEELLDMFLEYQIPSDMIRVDERALEGRGAMSVYEERRVCVEAVRGNLRAMQGMVQKEKDKQLAIEREKQKMRMLEEKARAEAARKLREEEERKRREEMERIQEVERRRKAEQEAKMQTDLQAYTVKSMEGRAWKNAMVRDEKWLSE